MQLHWLMERSSLAEAGWTQLLHHTWALHARGRELYRPDHPPVWVRDIRHKATFILGMGRSGQPHGACHLQSLT
jgi:hypothetical protein